MRRPPLSPTTRLLGSATALTLVLAMAAACDRNPPRINQDEEETPTVAAEGERDNVLADDPGAGGEPVEEEVAEVVRLEPKRDSATLAEALRDRNVEILSRYIDGEIAVTVDGKEEAQERLAGKVLMECLTPGAKGCSWEALRVEEIVALDEPVKCVEGCCEFEIGDVGPQQLALTRACFAATVGEQAEGVRLTQLGFIRGEE